MEFPSLKYSDILLVSEQVRGEAVAAVFKSLRARKIIHLLETSAEHLPSLFDALVTLRGDRARNMQGT